MNPIVCSSRALALFETKKWNCYASKKCIWIETKLRERNEREMAMKAISLQACVLSWQWLTPISLNSYKITTNSFITLNFTFVRMRIEKEVNWYDCARALNDIEFGLKLDIERKCIWIYNIGFRIYEIGIRLYPSPWRATFSPSHFIFFWPVFPTTHLLILLSSIISILQYR